MGQLKDTVEKIEKIERIAHGDYLDMITEIMPYLLQRREAARHMSERGKQPEGAEYIQAMNKEIKEILHLF